MKIRLNFEQRIFATLLFVSISISCLSLGSSYYVLLRRTEADYFNKYQSLSSVIGNSLLQLEQNTDILMLNAAKVVQSQYSPVHLQNTESLRNLAAQLNLTHIFIINRHGDFIRSTNESPNLIPNLFSFSDQYRQLITGSALLFKTPIIPPEPELNPYKFLMVATPDRKFIIEVGIKAEFISRTLSQALREDPNLKEINLFAPNGTSLGSIAREPSNYKRKILNLSNVLFNTPITSDDSITYFTKVSSSQPICYQCDKANLSRSGEYYYVLESKVSRSALSEIIRTMGYLFAVLLSLLLFISFIIARLLSKHLVENICMLTKSIREISLRKNLRDRVPVFLDTSELNELSKSFNELLETLEVYQSQIVDSQKERAEVEIARQVGHDIRSPLSALQILSATLKGVPEEWKDLFLKSCNRIQRIADDLMKRQSEISPVLIAPIIADVVREKKLLHPSLDIRLSLSQKNYSVFALVEAPVFTRVISNILNNAIEASDKPGGVTIAMHLHEATVDVVVTDSGSGFAAGIIDKIGLVKASTKKEDRGLGLLSASRALAQWDGKLGVENLPGTGARVTLSLNLDLSWAEPERSIFVAN